MDIVTKEKRSQMMSGIRAKNTKPEIIIRKLLFSKGLRFRIHKNIAGIKPDIVLKKYNLCIFVHGCYWHRHKNCKLTTTPKTNTDFWENKFLQNVKRDNKTKKLLTKIGWNVGIIWECSIRNGSFFTVDFYKLFNSSENWQFPP